MLKLPFNSRQVMILEKLLKSDIPLPAHEMGEQFGLSARSVRYELAALGPWTAKFGVTIHSEPRKGVRLIGNAEAMKALQAAIAQVNPAVVMTAQGRDQLMLFTLLVTTNYLPAVELEKRAGVSAATLTRSLSRLENWLEGQQLYIQRKSKSGLAIVGREVDRRHALIALILDVFPEMALLDYCMWGKNPLKSPVVKPNGGAGVIFKKLEMFHLPDSWRHIARLESERKLTLADNDHLYLALYLGITLFRVSQERLVELPPEMIQFVSGHHEYALIMDMAERVNRELNQKIPPVEVAQLTIEAISALRVMDVQEVEGVSQAQAVEIVGDIADQVRTKLCLPVAEPEALARMAEHLWRAFTRLKYNLPISNPLTERVQKAFPDLWIATQSACVKLQPKINVVIPPEELAYLTMYLSMAFGFPNLRQKHALRVVVVCPTGGITAWMLVSRLRAELPELEIMEVASIRQLFSMNLDGVSAIISTALFTFRDMMVISASPLVTEQEVIQIREKLSLPPSKAGRLIPSVDS